MSFYVVTEQREKKSDVPESRKLLKKRSNCLKLLTTTKFRLFHSFPNYSIYRGSLQPYQWSDDCTYDHDGNTNDHNNRTNDRDDRTNDRDAVPMIMKTVPMIVMPYQWLWRPYQWSWCRTNDYDDRTNNRNDRTNDPKIMWPSTSRSLDRIAEVRELRPREVLRKKTIFFSLHVCLFL